MRQASPQDEKEWYNLLAKGDQESMSRIFNRYYSRLCYFANTIIDNRSESEDLAMKAMSVLWESARAGAEIGRIEAYLFTIVRNGCYDYLKHQRVKTASFKHLVDETQIENFIEAALIQEDIVEKVFQEIQNLPEKCRQVAELMFVRGLTAEEAAQKLNVTESTVRSQKSRALSLLKTSFIKQNLLFLLLFLRF